MLRVFQATDKTYSTNGDLIINPTKAEIHKEDNGDFYLDLETIFDEKNVNISAQQGITATSSNGFLAINDNDISKQVELTNIQGDTSQDGTPTPSTPQAVNVVSGEQDILVCGRNISPTNINDWESGQYSNVDGSKSVYSSRIRLKELLKVQPNTTYYFNTYATDTNYKFIVRTYDKTGAFKRSIGTINNDTTFLTNGTEYYLGITMYNSASSSITFDTFKGLFENGDIKPFICLNSESNKNYEAYNGATYGINLGKNLFDKDNAPLLNMHIGSSTFANNAKARLTYIYIQPNTTYTISKILSSRFYVATSTAIPSNGLTYTTGKANNNATQLTITSGANDQYLAVYFYNGDYDTLTPQEILDTLQIEKGSIATTYTPYKTPIELCKIGDYKDRIYKDNGTWYIEKNIGKIVLNGSELGSIRSDIHNENTICYRTDANVSNIKTGTPVFSNCFQCLNNTSDIEHIRYIGAVEYRFQIFLLKTTASTSQEVQTWLSTHNTIVYYALDTPTITEITDTELINQLNAIQLLSGLNNITISSADLVGQITIRYNYLDAITNSIKYVDYLVPNNIIVANTPQGEQAFRISNVDKTRRKIKLKAYHVFYDSENYLIEDSYVVDKNCNDALDHLNNATSDTSPFTTISNVSTIDSYRCVRKSLFEAIQVVIERWGGHLVRDNWTIGVYNTIGQDNGVTIRYGKNLKDITASYNWDEVVTKLLPVGKDGILLNALDPTTSIYVESTIQYDIPYTKKVSFEQDNISEDDYKDEQGNLNEEEYKQALVNDLSQKAQNYVQNNSVPKVNYTLSANVEKVSDIGDTIEVIDEKLGINIMTNIISYDYNCILDKYTELEFGNFTPELKNLMTTITEETEKIVEEGTNTIKVTLTNELQEATSQIWNALGNSYVIYEGDKILIVDSLPKETATNVIMINNGGIGFSQTGITGTFQSAWTIDNVLNMEQINVINLTADLIKGGTLKLGSNLNQNGQIEVYDESNSLIAELNKNGLKMYGVDGSYVLMNNSVGFAGYDRNDTPIYWVNGDEFHMKKSVVEEEITLCNKMRFIPITITDGNNNIVNDGIGLVSVAGGGN